MAGRIKGVSHFPARCTVLLLRHVGLLSFLIVPLCCFATTPSVTLAWDPSPDLNVVAYRIYYGIASLEYTNFVTVAPEVDPTSDDAAPPPPTTSSVTNLLPGGDYYFAATAIDSFGQESDFSNEVIYTVPDFTNAAPSFELEFPTNGTALSAPADMLLRVKPNGHLVRQVEFFSGTNSLFCDTSFALAEYTYAWKRVGAGAYSITARIDYDFAYSIAPGATIVVTNSRSIPYTRFPAETPDSPAGATSLVQPAGSDALPDCFSTAGLSDVSTTLRIPSVVQCLFESPDPAALPLRGLGLFVWCQVDSDGAVLFASTYCSAALRSEALERVAMALAYKDARAASLWLAKLSMQDRETIALRCVAGIITVPGPVNLSYPEAALALLALACDRDVSLVAALAQLPETTMRVRVLKLICALRETQSQSAVQ